MLLTDVVLGLQTNWMWWRDGLKDDAVDAREKLDAVSSEFGESYVAAFRAQLDQAVVVLQGKLAAREVKDMLRQCKSKVSTVAKHTSQRNPAWWKQGLNDDAPKALDALAEGDDKYGNVVDWVNGAAELRQQLDEACSKLRSLQAERALSDDKRAAQNKVKGVSKQLTQTNPAWHKQGLADAPGVSDFLDELAEKHSDNPAWSNIDAEVRSELAAAVSQLKKKLGSREVADDEREAERALRTVSDQLKQTNPAWWKEGIENASQVRDKLDEFADKHEGVDLWIDIDQRLRTELDDALQQLKKKLAGRELEDDHRDLKSVLRNVTSQLTQTNPAWWTEGLDNANDVNDKIAELADKYVGVDLWVDVEQQIRTELENAVKELKTKLAGRQLEDDEDELKSALRSVTSQLSQRDPAWWKEGLENASGVTDKLDEFAEKYSGIDAWIDIENRIRSELDAAVKELKTKQAGRFMEDDHRELKSVLNTVTRQLTQSDPAWWKDGLDNASKVTDKLDEFAEKYSGIDAWIDVENQIRSELDAAVKELKTKQAARFMEDDHRELKSVLNTVTRQLTQVDPAWWKDGLENASKVTDKLDEFAEKYTGIDAWVNIENQIRSELDAAVKELKTKQAARFMDDDKREVKNALRKVTQQLTQVDPAWWKQGVQDATIVADKLAEFVDKYDGLDACAEFTQQLQSELESAVSELKTKLAARDLEDDQRAAKAALSKVTSQLSQVDHNWWKDGLAQAGSVRDQLDSFAEKYTSSGISPTIENQWTSFEADVRGQLDVAVKELKTKLAQRSLQDDQREVKTALSTVTGQLSQVDPAWWKTGLQNATSVQDKLDTFADKYADIDAWLEFEVALREELSAAVSELKSKLSQRCLEDDKRAARVAIDRVSQQLRQTDPAWWKTGLQDSQKSRDKLDELADKHSDLGTEAWIDIDRQFRIDLDAAVQSLKSKLADRSLEDDVRDAKSLLRSVTQQLSQVDYRWWQEGIAKVSTVVDKLDSLSDKYSTTQAGQRWREHELALRQELRDAEKSLKSKLADRFLKDDETTAKNLIASVTKQLSQKDPAWWKEGLEHSATCVDELQALEEKYSGIEAWNRVNSVLRSELDTAVAELRSKLSSRDFVDDKKSVESQLAGVERQLGQRDPAWWTEGLSKASSLRDSISALSEKHYNNDSWSSFEGQVLGRLHATEANLRAKIAERQQQDDVREVKGLITQRVSAQLKQSDPAWWRDGLQAAKGPVIDKLNELSDKYSSLQGGNWSDVDKQLRGELSASVVALQAKLAARELSDDQRSASQSVETVRKQLSQTDPAWWKEGLTQAKLASDLLDELQDKYDGFGDWVSEDRRLRSHLEQVCSELRAKLAERDQKDDQRRCRMLAENLESNLSKGDPKWWAQGLTKDRPALNAALSELACKHASSESWAKFDNAMFSRMEVATEALRRKIKARDFDDDVKRATSAIVRVEGALKKTDPAWWTHGVNDAKAARDVIAALEAKYDGDFPSNDLLKRLREASQSLRSKLADRTLETDVAAVSAAIALVADRCKQSDPAWWRTGLLKDVPAALDQLDELASKYDGVVSWTTQEHKLREDLNSHSLTLKRLQQQRTLQDDVRKFERRVREIESALQQCDGAWWSLAIASALKVKDDILEMGEDRYSGNSKWDTDSQSLIQRLQRAVAALKNKVQKRDFEKDAKQARSVVAAVAGRAEERDPAWLQTGLAEAATARDSLDAYQEKYDENTEWKTVDTALRQQLSDSVTKLKTKLYQRQMADDVKFCTDLVRKAAKLECEKDAAWWRSGLDAIKEANDVIAALQDEKYGDDFGPWTEAVRPLHETLANSTANLRGKLGARQLASAAWDCGLVISQFEEAASRGAPDQRRQGAIAADHLSEFELSFGDVPGFASVLSPLRKRLNEATATMKRSVAANDGLEGAESDGINPKAVLPPFQPFPPFESSNKDEVVRLSSAITDAPADGEHVPSLPAMPELPPATNPVREAAEKASSTLASRASQLPWPCQLVVDWSFVEANSFTSKTPEEQLSLVKVLTTTLCRKIVLGSTGISGAVGDNETVKTIMSSMVRRIVLTFDAADSVAAENHSTFYSFSLDEPNAVLTIAINMSSHEQKPDDAREKLNDLLQLPTRLLMADAQKSARTAEFMLSQKLGLSPKDPQRVRVTVDTDGLLAQQGWQRMSRNDQASFVKQSLCKTLVKAHIASADGIGGVAAENPVVAEALRALVSIITVEIDAGNTIRSTIGGGSYGTGWEIIFDRTAATLHMRYNISEMRAFTGFDDKLDHALDIVARRANAAAESMLNSYSKRLSSKVGLSADVVVDWQTFVDSHAFKTLSVQQQKDACKRLVQMADSLLGHLKPLSVGEQDWPKGVVGVINSWQSPELKRSAVVDAAKRNIKRVRILYSTDGSISGSERIAVEFDDDGGILTIKVALAARDMPRWDPDKLLRCVIGNMAAKDAADVLLASESATASKLASSRIVFTATWSSLTADSSFQSLKDVEQRKKIMAVAAQARALVAVIETVSAHRIGKAALQEKLRKISFVASEDHGIKTPVYSFGGEELVVALSTSTMDASDRDLITPLRLRWLLGVLLDFETATGNARATQQTQELRKAFSESFTTSIDWSFLSHSEFLNLTPEQQSQICNDLSGPVVKQMLRGLCAVCDHPIGLKCVQDNIASLNLSFSVTGSTESIKRSLSVKGKGLVFHATQRTLPEAARTRFKEHIEFAYDLVVAIAVDNATDAKKQLEKRLGDASSSSLRFQLAIPLDFTKTEIFRDLEPPQQADIITCLYNLPPLVGSASSGSQGLVAVLEHSPVVDRLRTVCGGDNISVTAVVRVDDSIVAPARWSIVENSGLQLEVSLSHVLGLPKVGDWTPRVLDCLSLVETVGRLQTNAEHETIWSATLKALHCDNAIPLSIDWDSFVQSQEYRSLSAAQRLEAVHNVQTHVLRHLFHGDAGVTGPRGLCEFEQVTAVIRKDVQKVMVAVDPTASANNGTCTVRGGAVGAGGVLTLVVGLSNVRSSSSDASAIAGVAQVLEVALNLRPVRQAAAVARGAQTVSKACGSIGVPVTVDWDAFVASPKVAGDKFGYVAQIDAAANKAVGTVAGGGRSFSNVDLNGPHAAALLSKVKEVVVEVDTTNSTVHNPGVTQSLIPRYMKVSNKGGRVHVTINQRGESVGCFRQVIFHPFSCKSTHVISPREMYFTLVPGTICLGPVRCSTGRNCLSRQSCAGHACTRARSQGS